MLQVPLCVYEYHTQDTDPNLPLRKQNPPPMGMGIRLPPHTGRSSLLGLVK